MSFSKPKLSPKMEQIITEIHRSEKFFDQDIVQDLIDSCGNDIFALAAVLCALVKNHQIFAQKEQQTASSRV
jgi:hypothetical protein